MKQPIDYSAVLADLERRKMKLEQLIGGVKELMHQENGTSSRLRREPTVTISLSSNAFHGMSISDAAVKYLRMCQERKKSREIAEALEAGGYRHESKNFVSTVTTVLVRKAKQNEPFTKTKAGWGLYEWGKDNKH